MQPDYDLKAILPKQGPIIPTLEAFPVPFQCIGETNPLLATDRELDDLGTHELFLLSGRFVGFLRRQFASGDAFASLGGRLVCTPTCGVRIRGLYGSLRVRWTNGLKHIMLTLRRWKQRQD